MLPFSPTAADQIRFLLQAATGSDFRSELRELCQFADYGCEGSILLLQTCFDQIDFNGCSVQNASVTPNIISAVLRYLLSMPNFSTVICEAVRSTWITESFPANLSRTLNLSRNERLGIGLALSDSENMELRTIGQNFSIAQIEEICSDAAPDVPTDQIQDIVMFLSQSEGLAQYVDLFTKMLSLLQQKESIPFVLSPFLPDEQSSIDSPRQLDAFNGLGTDFSAILSEIEKEMSMADILGELGYSCTADVTRCKEMLSLLLPLNEETIAKILSTIVRTRIGLEDTQNSFSTFASVIGSNWAADSSCLNTWNIQVLVDSIKQLAPETNWKNVVEDLDHEGFYIPDEEAFYFFMAFYSTACQDPFPLNLICERIWKNVEGQLSFLKHAVCASPEVFTFTNSTKKLPYVESVRYPSEDGNMAWVSLDLLEILCQLAEKGHASFIRKMIELPAKQFPEVLLIGMAHCHTAYNLLQSEVSSTIFPLMLQNPVRTSVVSHLWNVNSNLVLRGILLTHSVDPESILRILDLCEELKILLTVLDSAPFSFSVKLAAVAARRECINLEQWLIDNLNAHRDTFFEVCLDFLKSMLRDRATENSSDYFQRSGASMATFQESFSIFFKVLQAHAGKLHSLKLSEEMKQLSSIQFNSGIRSDGTMELPSAERGADDVETEANAYFHQMFSGHLGIDVMVQMLARFKDSSDDRERKIFDCMIGNLFEEYKFFPKYPEKQLKIAAVLFGSLIKHQLVSHITLGIALRCVLDALRKSVDSKMFLFGAKALEQFMDRLIEWPQYCNHIVQISHLRSTHADLVSFIERALARISLSQADSNGITNTHIDQLQSSAPASADNVEVQQRLQGFPDDRIKASVTSISQVKPVPTPPVALVVAHSDSISNQKVIVSHSLPTTPLNPAAHPGVLRPPRSLTPAVLRPPSYNTGFGAALNIETLIAAAERRDAPIEAPPAEIQDKIFFMINNISATNLEAKSKEFTDILQEQYYPWFAQYMVMKRASIEPNFHDLYLKFLDKVNSRSLNKEIVKATYENCKVLLRSDLIKSSSEERSLLKNLGSWLGKFTIGRNQALRAREIDPKVLIIEAYEKGLMIAVIPFTSKILEPCQCSLAYQPPNPWTMAILSLLVEIYNLPNLKMNLKFDIEVLFKNLGVDLKDVKPTSLLKDRVREVEGNPDFSNKDISAPQPQIVAESNSSLIPPLSSIELQHQVTSASHTGVHPSAIGQYTSSIHLAPSTQGEDDKLTSLSIPERVPSAQAQSQAASSQSSFSANQLLTPISNILPHIVVNSKLSALGLQIQLQRIIPIAIERAVRDIISPVVQRSVTIATQTTKELVLKDYAMESDESRIRNAAHLMVSSLAGSLAHVTCKEPLRVAMSNQLRSFIQALNVNGELLEQAVQLVTNDNLDLGCAMIEQAATEKALQSIDGELAPTIAYRRKQRESNGTAFYDANTYSQGSYARVPEALRPKPGRLSAFQQRVYEDFVKFPWHNQSAQNPNVASASASLNSSNASVGSLPRMYSGAAGHSGMFSIPSASGFNTANQSVELAPEEVDSGSAQILSVSSSNAGVGDIAAQQITEVSTAVPFTPATTETQDMGAVAPSATGTETQGISVSETPLTIVEVLDKYQNLAQKLEALSSKDLRGTDIQGIIAEVPEIIIKCVNRDEAAIAIAQKVFKRLYENTSNSFHCSSHLAMLAAIKDVCKVIIKEITSWVIYLDEELKLNKDVTVGFIRFELLNLAEYDAHLAKLIDGGRNKAVMEFAISIIQILVIQEPGFNISEFECVIDTLSKLAMRPGCPESLLKLVEIARSGSTNVNSGPGGLVNKEDKAKQLMDKKVNSVRSALNLEDYATPESSGPDPVGFRDQVSRLFAEWYRICELPVANDATYTHYISQLHQNGLLKGDDLTDRFFRILTEIAVLHCLASEQMVAPGQLALQSPQQPQLLSYLAVDIYSKLVLLILKYHMADQSSSVAILLSKIISVAARVLLKDVEEKKSSFHPKPYFRLFINFILDLTSPEALDGVNFLVLTTLANAFHALQPLRVPGWSFAWLELVSHRSFMPKLLMINNQKGWQSFQRLLVDLFKFMEPNLRIAELAEPVRLLYKGTLRMLLVLLHDFPEFLCDYHFSFCDVIPPSCIQMRNVILSAFPVNMRLPDPCTPNLKIDLLPEINQSPRILSDVDGALKTKQMKNDVDNFLNTRIAGSFLADLKQRLLLNGSDNSSLGTRYNVPLINSLVLYVGMQAVQQQFKGSLQQTTPIDIMNTAALELYKHLVQDLDTDGRYQFLNAIANQLRYPNNQTHYFSCILLFLFENAREDMIREQITRVLLERLIVNRPHPWGLLITFIELIKNPRYNFWNQPFIHLTPDIEKLFESVSRSCGASRGVEDGLVSGSLTEAGH